MMPKMNGFELYKIIKGIDPEIKICVSTACEIMASDITQREFEQLNPPLSEACILKKPFERKELFSKLSQILSGKNISLTNSSENQKAIERPVAWTKRSTIFSQKGHIYIDLLNNISKEEGQSFPEHPTLFPFAGICPIMGSQDAGESPLFFKDFVEDYVHHALPP